MGFVVIVILSFDMFYDSPVYLATIKYVVYEVPIVNAKQHDLKKNTIYFFN